MAGSEHRRARANGQDHVWTWRPFDRRL